LICACLLAAGPQAHVCALSASALLQAKDPVPKAFAQLAVMESKVCTRAPLGGAVLRLGSVWRAPACWLASRRCLHGAGGVALPALGARICATVR
jgi:hypothetical protein